MFLQVLQSLQHLVPTVNSETGAGQMTFVGCDQNFYERGSVPDIKKIIA